MLTRLADSEGMHACALYSEQHCADSGMEGDETYTTGLHQ